MGLDEIKERISFLLNQEIIDTIKLGKDELKPGVYELYIAEATKRGIDHTDIPTVIAKKFLYAHTWRRFINFIIDYYGVYFCCIVIFFIPVRMLNISSAFSLVLTFLTIISYYILLEYRTNKTFGKLLTHTTVLMIDGSKPKLKIIIIRTFSRFIPFNTLVTLFTGISIHDRVSKTRCFNDVDVKRFNELSSL